MGAIWKVRTLLWGRFGLDGGAMFGVVPKPLWEKSNPADERNRIDLALRGLLLKGESGIVLVDCGAGSKWTEKLRDIYKFEEAGGVDDVLGRAGVRREEITHVVISHLHFDHAGGCTERQGGKIVPTFPQAKYFVQKRHISWAREPSLRDRASFVKEDFEPLLEKGVLVEVDGAAEILPGLWVEPTDGHTPGLEVVRVRLDVGKHVVFPSDIMPTVSHVPLPWVMGYDLQPVVTVSEKERILERAAREGDIVVFEHDPKVAAAEIAQGGKGYEVTRWFADPWEG